MGFSRATAPVLHFDDINGRPLVGGRLYTYEAGTSIPATTYRDSSGTDANTNPVLLDERGEAVVYLDESKSYKFVLKDSLYTTIWEEDGITAGSSGGGGGSSSPVWGHWLNGGNWQSFDDPIVYDMTPYLLRVEGNVGTQNGPPVLPAGVYDYKLEVAFNRNSVADTDEFNQYDLEIKYGDNVLRAMSFLFRSDTTANFILTEWAGGVFELTEPGAIKLFLSREIGRPSHLLKISHLFIHKIG